MTENIAKILGCESTDITVTTNPEGMSWECSLPTTEAQRAEVNEYLATGNHPLFWQGDYNFRIVAPENLLDDTTVMQQFTPYLLKLRLRNLPIIVMGGEVFMYINTVMSEDSELIRTCEFIRIEARAEIEE